MKNWQHWLIRDWNECFLEHFFRKRFEDDSPIVTLLVTPIELARAAKAPESSAEEVRDAFVGAMNREIAERDLIKDAMIFGIPDPCDPNPPRFVAHLIFTCLAATESSDELADEDSYLSRLDNLARFHAPDHTLHELPRLWMALSAWLAFGLRSDSYRELVLPDPGGYTRIGYTVRLAFPDRRDQRVLSEVLDAAGFSGSEPPVRSLIRVVLEERGRFRRPFIDAFNEFCRVFESDGGKATRSIIEHRFWAAVLEAVFRGRGAGGRPALEVGVQLFAEELDDSLAAFLLTENPVNDEAVYGRELDVPYGTWRFVLLASVDDGKDPTEAVTRLLFSGGLQVPRVSAIVEQGILPFVESAYGLLELASKSQLGQTHVALVKSALVDDIRRIFGPPTARVKRSLYDGWCELRGISLFALSSESLKDTPLSSCMLLQESLVPNAIRLVGGIPADDGWLGFKEVLPRISVARADSVTIVSSGGSPEGLTRGSGSEWLMPTRDHRGTYRVSALCAEAEPLFRTIQFSFAPVTERYKPAAEPAVWITEATRGTVTLAEHGPFTQEGPPLDAANLAQRVVLLGSEVGEFATDSSRTAWKVTSFGGRNVASRAFTTASVPTPATASANASARRHWRRLLFQSDPDPSDPCFEQARRIAKRHALASLRTIDLPPPPTLSPRPEHTTRQPATERLINVVASRASARAGIEWYEWLALTKGLLGVAAEQLSAVTRAWLEAGAIDIASNARWRRVAVFPIPPRLVCFRVGRAYQVTLSGLALSTTVGAFRDFAHKSELPIENRGSVSGFVPSTAALQTDSQDDLMAVSRALGLPVVWLTMDADRLDLDCRHDCTGSPPSNYEDRRELECWSISPDYRSPKLLFEHFSRKDRPDYWRATSPTGMSAWSFSQNVVRGWASAFEGALPVREAGETDLEALHGFLPLPVARIVALLSEVLPGPEPGNSWSYRYRLPHRLFRDWVLARLRDIFDISSLGRLEG